ncbi:putative ankyrin repeat protein RF_0381 [Halyomorpha halys]|uniref:putative ankyrin repeat protein RF_0381 n=1 Tax=Halyomorpha halys TaxID=286706 RepID=UPI0006D51478|nr:serine/threonine-protein phosphatase 6 regulatory ankyrin repeat subunit B-like [Halyomorpha halys]
MDFKTSLFVVTIFASAHFLSISAYGSSSPTTIPEEKLQVFEKFMTVVRDHLATKVEQTAKFFQPYTKLRNESLVSNITVDEFVMLEVLSSLANKDFTYTSFLLDIISQKNIGENKKKIGYWLKSKINLPYKMVYDLMENIANWDQIGTSPLPTRVAEEFFLLGNYSEVFLDACGKGDLKIVKWVLKSGTNLDLLTCIERAWENMHKETTKYLIANGALNGNLKGKKIVETINQDNETLLHYLSGSIMPDIVKDLLGGGAEPNSLGLNANSPLHQAVKSNDIETLKFLLQYGADLNVRNSNGDTALHAAVALCNANIASLLIDSGARLDIRNNHGITALQKAEALWVNAVILHLIKNNIKIPSDANLDQVVVPWTATAAVINKESSRECGKKAIKNRSDIVQLLLRKGGSSHLTDDVRTKLLLLLNKSTPSLIQDADFSSLIYKGFSGTSLINAVESDNVTLVKSMLEEGAALQNKDIYGNTALHEAASRGNTEISELLVRKGADVRAKNKVGWTPLHKAVFNGHDSVIKFLINNGADVNAKDANDDTPLHVAAVRGKRDSAQLLLDNGANIKAKDRDGWAPIHAAVQKGHIKLVNLLINKGADVNVRNTDGRTPLFFACQQGEDVIVKLLLQSGADVENGDLYGRSALHAAAGEGNAEVVKVLLLKGIDINSLDENGNTPLHEAAIMGQSESVEALLSKGAMLDKLNTKGWTALHEAAWKGHLLVIKSLLDHGMDIDARTSAGETALQLAARGDNPLVVINLLRRGAARDTRDQNGRTVLEDAALQNNVAMVKLLLDEGVGGLVLGLK